MVVMMMVIMMMTVVGMVMGVAVFAAVTMGMIVVVMVVVVGMVVIMRMVVRMPMGIGALDGGFGSAASACGTHHVVSIRHGDRLASVRVCKPPSQAIAVSTGTNWRASWISAAVNGGIGSRLG